MTKLFKLQNKVNEMDLEYKKILRNLKIINLSSSIGIIIKDLWGKNNHQIEYGNIKSIIKYTDNNLIKDKYTIVCLKNIEDKYYYSYWTFVLPE